MPVLAAQCLIDHHCENKVDKARLATRAANFQASRLEQGSNVAEGNLVKEATKTLPDSADAWYCKPDALLRRLEVS